jgi:plastocyanin
MFARLLFRLAVVGAPLVAVALPAQAENFTLTIKDHLFSPDTLKVKANEAFDITVINSDATAEEFESEDLHVEKVVQGGKQITVHVDALAPGSYNFVGEHHEDTATGKVVAE